ncbi:unnamed protein product [Discula destructiva]
MNPFAPINSYAIGAGYLGMGLCAYLRPQQYYRARFGFPVESPRASRTPAELEKASPEVATPERQVVQLSFMTMYFGVLFVSLQYVDSATGVTIAAAVVSFSALADGLALWRCGLKEVKRKAWAHWAEALALAGWAGSRLFLGYGEWAAFYTLHV